MPNFDWLKAVGATNEAVAVLNDQPQLFVTLILVIVGLIIQCLVIWYIHFATLKPEQKKKKEKKKDGSKDKGKSVARK
ncbi:hypothetical protein DCS_02404 [Drechmeria coniospora]|uniref:Uncharacterized protein n=1 Tax=Drechmeria coniospora TaxID=98403 RepID=A0A151GW55_DRECN|nr:hypothetical protein DCS_02404 [Drechmeria coniospora]KYK61262.1 hypothetical protein DCS_02404 [Drechmeria coniospora]ODA81026.1 hypothetical protein RJ55_03988 [Drechmeria coniospora]